MSRADPVRQRAGVIDIGSNSVRLVIFSISEAAIAPVFNEKVMAGLGRGLGETKRLSPEGREMALAALRRFRSILDGLGVARVKAVATAAVRVAIDGEEFAREAAIAAGVSLSILSGQDEGRMSARGVTAGFFQPRGLVGDLGGSSLELEAIGPGAQPRGETHMLGPLALVRDGDLDDREARKRIRRTLAASPSVKHQSPRVYAVGGAWRAFAKIAIDRSDYPLRVLHGFTMPASEVHAVAKYIRLDASRDALQSIAGRRTGQLKLTSMVLDELVGQSGARDVVISSYGLREGVVADLMERPAVDALADGIIAFAGLNPYQVAFGEALFAFTRPVFASQKSVLGNWSLEQRLHEGACLLADASGHYHPDHRADMAFSQTLYAPLSGVNHVERLFIAAASGARYTKRFNLPDGLERLAKSSQIERARQLGQAMRLGAVFSGRSAEILRRGKLERDDGNLILRVTRDHSAMVSETVERRLGQTADALGLKPQIVLD